MRTALCIFALALCAARPASAATYSDLINVYNSEAFQGADEGWRRSKASRIVDCGRFGKSKSRRVDILADRYLAIGAAIDAGSQSDAIEAAQALSSSIERNSRFGNCWKRISRSEGLTSKFQRLIAEF